jgi:ubiquinone biosynthesis protein Coq4
MNQYFGSDTSITLGEAIQKLRALEHEDDMTNQMSAEVIQALEQHDAVHVLFNCGTSIREEIAAHLWMLFATTANIGEMHRAVASIEHKSVLSNIGHFKLLGIWFTSLPRIIGIISKSLRMKKKLAIEELSQLKQKSLVEIRREYGIIL